jgi:hypothetical protein
MIMMMLQTCAAIVSQPTVTKSSFVLVDAGSSLFFSSQSEEQKAQQDVLDARSLLRLLQ